MRERGFQRTGFERKMSAVLSHVRAPEVILESFLRGTDSSPRHG
jgi:hypothetical protein